MAKRLSPTYGTGVSLAVAQSTLPFPPVAATTGVVTDWNGTDAVVPEFDLVMWNSTTDNVTVAAMWGVIPHAFTIVGTDLTSVDHTADTTGSITKTAHGFLTGDGPFQFTTTGAIPGGLALLTNYWMVKLTADVFQVATSLSNALKGVVVTITSNGSGTLTLTGTSACARAYWHEVLDKNSKQIGRAADGAVALTIQKAWSQRFAHNPLIVAYSLVGTLSASNVTATMYPVQDR